MSLRHVMSVLSSPKVTATRDPLAAFSEALRNLHSHHALPG